MQETAPVNQIYMKSYYYYFIYYEKHPIYDVSKHQEVDWCKSIVFNSLIKSTFFQFSLNFGT